MITKKILLLIAEVLRLKDYKIKRSKVFRLMILPLLILSLTTGCGSNSAGFDKIVIGIDDEFAPISFHDEQDKLVGFDIDLALEAGRRMGVEIEFKPIEWSKKKDELLAGHIDIIWDGLDITPERKEYMIFSKPYMDDRQILLVKKDSDLKIYSEYDLAGKVIGMQAGSTSDDYINSNEKLKKSVRAIKIYDKFGEAVSSLKNDEVDVVICDEIVARYEMNIHRDRLEIVEVRVGVNLEMGIGFRKEDTALRDKVQEAFDSMVKDGTAKKISEKWFNADLIKSAR